jgi:hypothetical protein
MDHAAHTAQAAPTQPAAAEATDAASVRTVDLLMRLLEDQTTKARIASDPATRALVLELIELLPEEHRAHLRMMLEASP